MHVSTSTHPVFAFRICLWISLIALGIVIIRKIIVSARKDENRKHAVVSEAAQGPTSTSAASVNPVPSDIPLKSLHDTEMKVEIGARNAVKAAEQADQAAEAAARQLRKRQPMLKGSGGGSDLIRRPRKGYREINRAGKTVGS